MNRFIVLALVLVLTLSVPASSLLAGDHLQTRDKLKLKDGSCLLDSSLLADEPAQDRTQTRDCISECPGDGDSVMTRKQNSLFESIMNMLKEMLKFGVE